VVVVSENMEKIPMNCPACDWSWNYGGKKRSVSGKAPMAASCPACGKKVKIPTEECALIEDAMRKVLKK
jgi:endogenous inhibitor of DNA gyrase (YacG/DUF329 family)